MQLRTQLGLAFVMLTFAADRSFAAKPFENSIPQPRRGNAYLNLLNNNQSGSSYQTLVRPQLDNIQRFTDSQFQLNNLNSQQQALLRRQPPPGLTSPSRQRGVSQNIRATGHQTRFLDGRRFQDQRHYFPQPGDGFP